MLKYRGTSCSQNVCICSPPLACLRKRWVVTRRHILRHSQCQKERQCFSLRTCLKRLYRCWPEADQVYVIRTKRSSDGEDLGPYQSIWEGRGLQGRWMRWGTGYCSVTAEKEIGWELGLSFLGRDEQMCNLLQSTDENAFTQDSTSWAESRWKPWPFYSVLFPVW